MALTALVALTLFVWTQHQDILAQTHANENAHQQALQNAAAMIEKASAETPQQLLNDARQKQGEEIQREDAERSQVYVPPITAQSSSNPLTYIPPEQAPPNVYPQTQSSDDSIERSNAQADRRHAEANMQTAMEPKQANRDFPNTPEGQQEFADWRHQVMEDRAQAVSRLQTRIDHDNDVINGQGSSP